MDHGDERWAEFFGPVTQLQWLANELKCFTELCASGAFVRLDQVSRSLLMRSQTPSHPFQQAGRINAG